MDVLEFYVEENEDQCGQFGELKSLVWQNLKIE